MSITCLRLSTNTSALVELKDKLVGRLGQIPGLCVKSRSQLSDHNWLCVNGIKPLGRQARATENERGTKVCAGESETARKP